MTFDSVRLGKLLRISQRSFPHSLVERQRREVFDVKYPDRTIHIGLCDRNTDGLIGG